MGKSTLEDIPSDLPTWDVLLLQEAGDNLDSGEYPAVTVPARWRNCAVIVHRRWARHIEERTTAAEGSFASITMRTQTGLITFVSAYLPYLRSTLGGTEEEAGRLAQFLEKNGGSRAETTPLATCSWGADANLDKLGQTAPQQLPDTTMSTSSSSEMQAVETMLRTLHKNDLRIAMPSTGFCPTYTPAEDHQRPRCLDYLILSSSLKDHVIEVDLEKYMSCGSAHDAVSLLLSCAPATARRAQKTRRHKWTKRKSWPGWRRQQKLNSTTCYNRHHGIPSPMRKRISPGQGE